MQRSEKQESRSSCEVAPRTGGRDKAHQVRSACRRLLRHGDADGSPKRLRRYPDDAQEAVEGAHPGTLDRAATFVDYMEGLLESADGRLVTQSTLDGIHGHADQALTALGNLSANASAHGAALDQAVESAINAAAPLAPASAGFAEAAQKIGPAEVGSRVAAQARWSG